MDHRSQNQATTKCHNLTVNIILQKLVVIEEQYSHLVIMTENIIMLRFTTHLERFSTFNNLLGDQVLDILSLKTCISQNWTEIEDYPYHQEWVLCINRYLSIQVDTQGQSDPMLVVILKFVKVCIDFYWWLGFCCWWRILQARVPISFNHSKI